MAGYDGTIKINTKLDTGGFTKGANELSAKQKRLSDQMNVQRNSIARMKAELDSLGKTKVATPEFVTIEKEIESLTTKLIAAQDRMDKFTELNPGDTSSRAFKSIEYDVKTLESRLREAERAKNELLETGKSHISGIDTKEYQDLSEKIEQSKNRLQELQLKAREADTSLQKLGNNGKKSLDKINKSGNKYGDLKTMFVRRLKGLILNLLIFNWICKGFRGLITGIGEGMQNLAKYSKQYNAQMSELKNTNTQLKNNFAAAFEPVLTVIIPILTQLSAWLVNVTNNISKFFAILGGKSSYTIAKKGTEDYAKSLDDVSKSASGANKQLASFDELEVLSSGNGNSSSNTQDMFEQIPLDEYSKNIEKLNKLFGELKKTFADGFNVGSNGADNLLQKYKEIQDNLQKMKEDFADIFSDEEVVQSATDLMKSIVYNAGRVTGSFAEIGANIGAGVTGGMAQYFDKEENKQFISNKISSIFKNVSSAADGIGDFAQALGKISEAFDTQGFKDIVELFTQLGTVIGLIAFDAITVFFSDVINFFATPVLDNSEELKGLLSDIFDLVSLLLEPAKMLLDYITGHSKEWEDGWFHQFASAATKANSDLLASSIAILREKIANAKIIILAFNSEIKKLPDVLKKVGEKVSLFKEKFTDLKQGVIESVIGIKNGVKVPINATITMFENFVNGIISAINRMIDGLNSIHFDIPDWVPGDLGGKSFGINISKIATLSIPRLATGTVVPPGMSEFLAVLGDNNKETEVVSPLSTIKEAVAQVMAEMGSNNDQSGDIIINIDGHEVFRVVREQNKEYKKATGQSAFA